MSSKLQRIRTTRRITAEDDDDDDTTRRPVRQSDYPFAHLPPRRQATISAFNVLSTKLALTPVQKRSADAFKRRWRQIKGPHATTEVWADTFQAVTLEEDAARKLDPLYVFRKDLSDYITNVICVAPVTCKSYGSQKAASDIDVTISAGIDDIQASLDTYIAILKFLDAVFGADIGHDKFFRARRDVFHFFDLNFYLSNFAIKRPDAKGDDLLSSYYLSTRYGPQHKEHNQYYYAVIEIPYRNHREMDKPETTVTNMYLNRFEKISVMRNVTHGAIDPNELVDILSQISTYEDECYHTQGAFFHVVLMMQRGIEFKDISSYKEIYINMLRASALENLTFAFTHQHAPRKMQKYLARYHDAIARIRSVDSTAVGPLIEVTNKAQIFGQLRKLIGYFVNPRTKLSTQINLLRSK